MVRPSFFLKAPAKVPRTVCACQPVVSQIWWMVAPSGRLQHPDHLACLLFSRVRGFCLPLRSTWLPARPLQLRRGLETFRVGCLGRRAQRMPRRRNPRRQRTSGCRREVIRGAVEQAVSTFLRAPPLMLSVQPVDLAGGAGVRWRRQDGVLGWGQLGGGHLLPFGVDDDVMNALFG